MTDQIDEDDKNVIKGILIDYIDDNIYFDGDNLKQRDISIQMIDVMIDYFFNKNGLSGFLEHGNMALLSERPYDTFQHEIETDEYGLANRFKELLEKCKAENDMGLYTTAMIDYVGAINEALTTA